MKIIYPFWINLTIYSVNYSKWNMLRHIQLELIGEAYMWLQCDLPREKKKSCKFDVDPRNITLKDVQKEPTINYNKLSLVPDHEWYCVNGVTPKPCQI